jgi:hypothetical protein
MKTIEEFDQHRCVWLRAVPQESTDVTRLSQHLAIGQCQLYEVWLLPQREPALSSDFLKEARFDTIEGLRDFYQVESSPLPLHASSMQHELWSKFVNHLHFSDTEFHFSILRTVYGPVISVVFGSRRAMRIVYDHGLRERAIKEADEESSI